MEYSRLLQYQFPLMRGDDVRAVQQALIAINVNPPCGTADGVYGDATRSSVAAFQSAWNVRRTSGDDPIAADGKVGPTTWAALFGTALRAGTPASHVVNAGPALPPDIATEIPITQEKAGPLKRWMITNFSTQIQTAIAGTPVDIDLVCAIAAKENLSLLAWPN